jgi:hypothetical protein
VNAVGAAKDAEILARFRDQLISEIKDAADD